MRCQYCGSEFPIEELGLDREPRHMNNHCPNCGARLERFPMLGWLIIRCQTDRVVET